MSHEFLPVPDPQGRPRVRCKKCRLELIAWPGVDLDNLSVACGEKILGISAAPGLGDRVAALLAAVGITEPRVNAWLVRLGRFSPIQPRPGQSPKCGCGFRLAWLNQFGRQIVPWLRAEFIGRPRR